MDTGGVKTAVRNHPAGAIPIGFAKTKLRRKRAWYHYARCVLRKDAFFIAYGKIQ